MPRDTLTFDLSNRLTFGTYEDALTWIGRKSEIVECEEINTSQVRMFAALVQDANPAYWDEAWARARYGGVLAPPGTLFVWGMSLPWDPVRRARPPLSFPSQVPLPGETLVNASTETEFFRRMHVGDRLRVQHEVVSVSAERKSALGVGHFIRTQTECWNQSDERVASTINVMFRYRSDSAIPRAAAWKSAPSSETDEQLPSITLPVTLTMCVLDAAATRDFFPGHHDRDFARAHNARDVFLNTMFFHGLVDRIATDWAGPEAFVRARRLEMVQPVCVGDTLRSEGRVVRRRRMVSGGDEADIEIRLMTELGIAAVSVLTVQLTG
jgi:acyl dehydratase